MDQGVEEIAISQRSDLEQLVFGTGGRTCSEHFESIGD
jgi:hypothetical protein